MSFDFSIKQVYPAHNFLIPDDLRFFYYDVEFAYREGIYNEDSWGSVMKEFEGKVDIAVCEKEDMPDEVGSNTIRFTPYSRGTEISHFFSHLRNAFAHYRIYREGEIFHLMDKWKYNKQEYTTMIGKIEADLLKEICFRFLEIHYQIFDQYQDSINPLDT